ncbi:MAG: hypothetical protein ABSE73_11435 [Planctomycetota bacterium]
MPEHRLKRGDVVRRLVAHFAELCARNFGKMRDKGVGTAVPAAALEPLREDEVLCARPLSMALECGALAPL